MGLRTIRLVTCGQVSAEARGWDFSVGLPMSLYPDSATFPEISIPAQPCGIPEHLKLYCCFSLDLEKLKNVSMVAKWEVL